MGGSTPPPGAEGRWRGEAEGGGGEGGVAGGKRSPDLCFETRRGTYYQQQGLLYQDPKMGPSIYRNSHRIPE